MDNLTVWLSVNVVILMSHFVVYWLISSSAKNKKRIVSTGLQNVADAGVRRESTFIL